MSPKTVIIITGPTASGKTDLAIGIARHFNTSVISADSRQCFRELNAGVAKPDAAQLEMVKHFFINSHSIQEDVNAAIFENLAMHWSGQIFSDRDTVVVCGGTGLYLRAFCEGLDEIPLIDEGIRKNILAHYRDQGLPWLKENIRLLDPLFDTSGETDNPQRMMRALEVIQSTGRSLLSFRSHQKKQRPFRILQFGIRLPRKELYQRINHRVDLMMEKGLLDEVKSLVPFRHLNALQTVGYTELFEYIQGKTSLEESISLIKQNTRHYAKRQMTWLNKNDQIVWLDDNYLSRIITYYGNAKI